MKLDGIKSLFLQTSKMSCRFSHLFSLFLKYSLVPVRLTYSYVICLSHSNFAAIEESLAEDGCFPGWIISDC